MSTHNITANKLQKYCLTCHNIKGSFNFSNYPVILVELLGLAAICKNNTHYVLVYRN